ncbi:MAG TPA: nucleoside-diphosphate sugar epimerase/dehydratase [Dictyoglomaceae bacterium]|nr:nucleoside-diphosphate sugar epimerase/dehydratase [Dictyoglomaceae bacterium]
MSIYKNFWFHLILDIFSYIIGIILAFFIRFEFSLPSQYLPIIYSVILREIPLFLIFYYIFKIHTSLWEYFSLEALKDLTLAVTLEKITFYISYLLFPINGLPRSTVIISYAVSLLMLFSYRALVRWFYEKYRKNSSYKISPPKKVILIGAGDAGEKILREIKTHNELNYEVIGFLDDDPRKIKRTIHGVKVLGPISSLSQVAREKKVDEVIIVIPSAPPSLIKNIISMASKMKIPVKILPGIWELIDGKVSVNKIRNVKIEDLLSRDVINLNSDKIREYLKGEKVLVTGAGGSIGAEICRQVASYGPEKLILVGRGENSIFNIELELKMTYPNLNVKSYIADIKDREKMFYIISQEKPDIVFHAAAHKHVPLMEENPDEAVQNNVFGTMNVIDASCESKADKFIFISTDKAVYPNNIMGATKRIGEMLIQHYNGHTDTKLIAVRFGNVLGSRGSVLEVFKRELERGGPLTITHEDMERYFMTIPEAVGLVLQAGSIGESGDLFVLDMGEPVKIMDLAKNFIELSGYSLEDIKIKITGLRPGEKLKEELWEEGEVIEKTEHPKIYRIKGNNHIDTFDFKEYISKLHKAAESRSKSEIEKIFKELIPTYKMDINETNKTLNKAKNKVAQALKKEESYEP